MPARELNSQEPSWVEVRQVERLGAGSVVQNRGEMDFPWRHKKVVGLNEEGEWGGFLLVR